MLPIEHWRGNFDERSPIYLQIVDRFCRSLVKGEASAGDRIPSIRDLALTLQVNANTVQRSYQELERRDLIYSQRGMGYFVMNDEKIIDRVRDEMVRESTSRFLKEMEDLGYTGEQIMSELQKQLKGSAHSA